TRHTTVSPQRSTQLGRDPLRSARCSPPRRGDRQGERRVFSLETNVWQSRLLLVFDRARLVHSRACSNTNMVARVPRYGIDIFATWVLGPTSRRAICFAAAAAVQFSTTSPNSPAIAFTMR